MELEYVSQAEKHLWRSLRPLARKHQGGAMELGCREDQSLITSHIFGSNLEL